MINTDDGGVPVAGYGEWYFTRTVAQFFVLINNMLFGCF